MTVPGVLRSDADSQGKQVRILLVAPSLRILGGLAVQAGSLFEHLSREPGFKVSFVPHNPQLPGPLNLLQRIKYVRTIVTSLVYFAKLFIEIPRNDVIHVFSASYFSFLLAPTPAIFLARLFGKKAILNYHSGEAEDHLRCWPRTAVPIIKVADELIVPSQYLVDVFSRFGLHASIVANMIDQDQFKFRERQPLLPIFLSNRNLYPLYNVACILRAFAKIQQRFPESRLVVAGDGRQRSMIEALARDLKLQNVQFRGLVAPEKMNQLYEETHIFLNGSNIDNTPISILESFASGMAVVSTNAGGIPYIVDHGRTGLLVPKNDHEAMASQAIQLLESPELAASIVRNAHDECPAYTWDAVRETWLATYMRLAGREASIGAHANAKQMIHSRPLQGAAEES
jgi:glycosyltransferase involved in cell wall biosynthesis